MKNENSNSDAGIEKALDAFLAGYPKEQECSVHPSETEKLSRERTRRRASVTDAGFEFFTAVYSPCPVCERNQLLEHGVPPALLHSTFENFIPRTAKEREHLALVREFCERVRRGFLFLLGPVGVGKSHLAVAAMRAFLDGLFVKQSQLLRQLRLHYHDNAIANPIAGAQEARILVLDELGVSSGGRDELPMLDEILSVRYEQQRPTIITSNLAWDVISTALGDRLLDRLSESCFRVLVFAGQSHRPKRRGSYFGGRQP